MNTAKGIAAALVATALVIALGIGLWHLDWFVQEKNVDKQTGIEDRSLSRQTALVTRVTNDATEIARIDVRVADSPEVKASLTAQRKAIVVDMCDAAGRLTGKVALSIGAQDLVDGECL